MSQTEKNYYLGRRKEREIQYSSVQAHLTEVIKAYDPQAKERHMRENLKKEIKGLINRVTFQVILKKEIPPNANILTARFVLVIKSKATVEATFKAHYVIGGHKDALKSYLVHGSQKCRLHLSVCCWHRPVYWDSRYSLQM